jgi:maltodextrin utilization protein YvdJ
MAHNNTNIRTDAPKSRVHNLILQVVRVLQFLSALTSLILFSVRIAKIIRLANHATHSNGAVEGILAAVVLYTILATILQLGSQKLRFLLMVFDIPIRRCLYRRRCPNKPKPSRF